MVLNSKSANIVTIMSMNKLWEKGELNGRFRCAYKPNGQEMIVQLFDFLKASCLQ